MKKVLSLLLVIAQCLLFCSCDSDESDRRSIRKKQATSDTEGQYYFVKEFKIYLKDRDGEWVLGEERPVKFDQNGFPVEWRGSFSYGCVIKYDSDYSVSSIKYGFDAGEGMDDYYEYDEYGNVTFESWVRDDFESSVKYKYRYENGNVIEEMAYNGENTFYKLWNHYDKNGNLTSMKSERWRYWEGEVIQHIMWSCNFEYDKYENLIGIYKDEYKLMDVDENGNETMGFEFEPYLWKEFEYDADGNLIDVVEYKEDTIITSQTFEYDSFGRVVSFLYKWYYEDGEYAEQYKEYEYDKTGKVVKEYIYEDGGLEQYTEFTYCETPVTLNDAQVKVFHEEGFLKLDYIKIDHGAALLNLYGWAGTGKEVFY